MPGGHPVGAIKQYPAISRKIMKVIVRQPCYFVREQRRVLPGEIVEVPTLPEAAIARGLVEPVLPVPECPEELGYE